METTAVKALSTLRELKSVVFSSIRNGKPTSRIIDVMVQDDKGLLFTTCTIKPFFKDIMEAPFISVTGITPDYVQIRLDGELKEVDHNEMEKIYKENPEFKKLFPNQDNMSHYKVFRIFKGKGELFDLSGKDVKMQRQRFSFGGETVEKAGVTINDSCISCAACFDACPFSAISQNDDLGRYEVDRKFCDECGCCVAVCPVDAIKLPTGM